MKKNSTNLTTRKLTDEEILHYSKIVPKKQVIITATPIQGAVNSHVMNSLKEIAHNNLRSYVTDNHEKLSYLGKEVEEYEESVLKESEKELLLLLNVNDSEDFVEQMSFDQLSKFTFDKAHNFINKMTLPKRIQILHELDRHLIHTYDATKEYNDKGFGKSISPNVFYSLMGKIKHLEILQSWLYGIE